MKHIGILGGTFNPIHIGHLAVAQTVCDRLKLDKVLFIPSFFPPHKSQKQVIAAKHRWNMVRLAIQDNKKFQACDHEIRHRGKSYSILTLQHLHQTYPRNTKFYFIIGSDMLPGLKRWKRIDELLKLVRFVVVSRKGYTKTRVPYPYTVVSSLDLGISSSTLRQNLKKRKMVNYLLPEKVTAYIKKHKLYC